MHFYTERVTIDEIRGQASVRGSRRRRFIFRAQNYLAVLQGLKTPFALMFQVPKCFIKFKSVDYFMLIKVIYVCISLFIYKAHLCRPKYIDTS